MKRIVVLAVVILSLCASPKAKADAGHDFLVSCSYGVLAGTLVGAATLAFTEQPGQNLNKVARGASLGLYAGILLGLYVTNASSPEDEDAAAQLRQQTQFKMEPPRLQVFPLITERGLDGLGAEFRVLNF